MNRIIIAIALVALTSTTILRAVEPEKIHWITFEEAVKLSQKEPRKIIVDVYTDWCGWCKKMDATTFSDPIIVKYVNEKYYAVKLNAETRDTLRFNGNTFAFVPEYKANEFAVSLLNGQMSYPTTVYLNEKFEVLSPVPGYLKPPMLEKILKFYGENTHTTMKWEDFIKTFVGEAKE
jgi:thioredoxin-related protein